jgi:PleD family two-component response regulator
MMGRTLLEMSQILFADDDEPTRTMVGETLRAAGHQVRLAADGQGALQELDRQTPELVILDYRMGRPDGFEVCRRIKTDPRFDHIPVLILTGEGRVEDRIEGFEAGANDYLAKPFDVRELVARANALLQLSRRSLDRNPTSGLPGGEAIQREFERRRAGGDTFSICYFDLDHFKPFGDRFGFTIADRVLRDTGRTLEAATAGGESFLGHIGGDDFIVMCQREEALPLVQRVQDDFQDRLRLHIPAEVMGSGFYRGLDREGRPRTFPLTRLAAAIIHVDPFRSATLGDLSEEIADAKRRAKDARGEGIAITDLAPPAGHG